MAQPQESMPLKNGLMVLRIFALVTLLGAMALLVTNSASFYFTIYGEYRYHFKDFYSYRYVGVTIGIGIVYSLVQIVLNVCNYMCTGSCIWKQNGFLKFDFFGDKLVSLVLASGVGAGFGTTKDMIELYSQVEGAKLFFLKGYAVSGLLLLASFSIAMLSVYSSFALHNKS